MNNKNSFKIEALIKKGVKIPNPESIEIGDAVDLGRIAHENVSIHSGCKIYGKETLISEGAKLGQEGPVTIDDCYIGPSVNLKMGYFKEAVFLNKAIAGSGAHVRTGTILEEEASIAHTVGLKQTLLFPFVTLGSLINFCDCFMSGGTSRKNHSEVGSSYIHFNYSPNQDKATPSLLGDVPNGVMLNQKPIFLGGQGGLVGPCRLAFGTVTAAGSVRRKDELRPGRLLIDGQGRSGNVPYNTAIYRSIKRIIINNVIYIANLMALGQWYTHVRSLFVSSEFPEALFTGLNNTLEKSINERIKRLHELADKMPNSKKEYKMTAKDKASEKLIKQKNELFTMWPRLEDSFRQNLNYKGEPAAKDSFLQVVQTEIQKSGKHYIPVIKGLEPEDKAQGTAWLQGIVDHIYFETIKKIPSFG